jgi:hypothetical protein
MRASSLCAAAWVTLGPLLRCTRCLGPGLKMGSVMGILVEIYYIKNMEQYDVIDIVYP